MSNQTILEKVQNIISKALALDATKVTLESSFRRDLGADSLDSLEIVMAIEDAFGVEFDEEAASKVDTVNDLIHISNMLLRRYPCNLRKAFII